jgi:hypothetical protein
VIQHAVFDESRHRAGADVEELDSFARRDQVFGSGHIHAGKLVKMLPLVNGKAQIDTI